MNMKNKIIYATLILLLVSALFVQGCSKSEVAPKPNSFAYKVYSDLSSASTSRQAEATVAFSNGKLVDGSMTYSYQGPFNQSGTTWCYADLESMTWKDNSTNESCPIRMITVWKYNKDGSQESIDNINPPLTIKEFEKRITDKSLVPKTEEDPYCHYHACYEILLAI
jgi:ABC-type oligopeptide transport system substrate-binding subunit